MSRDGFNIAEPDAFAHRVATPVPYLVIAGEKMGFGVGPTFKVDFAALGATGDERFANYVEQQLSPTNPPNGIPPVDDSAFQAQVAAAGFQTIYKSHTQLWLDHVVGNQDRYRPVSEIELLTFMRAVYSKQQLREVLADFWHNHFNAYGWDYWSAPVWVSYDGIFRTHMLGNFRTMLEQVAKHSAMLYFLDQYTSSRSGPNENFARELFELHTLGAENYVGVIPQQDVPLDDQGRPIGYVDNDVFEATRCLTGWTVNNGWAGPLDDGSFYFNSEWHDRFQKNVLGEYVAPDGNASDGITVLDALCSHPGTGRHIARKLCERLISDHPPQSIVDAAAQVFNDNSQDLTQLKKVVRTILLSDEFKATWGEKAKRPLETVVSMMRATNYQLDFHEDADDLDGFLWLYEQTGQPLFSWRGPDGYPDTRDKWESTTPRVMSWRLSNWLTDRHLPAPSDGVPRMNVQAQTPADVRTATELVDFWVQRILGRAIAAGDRQILINFMAQGYNPNFDLPWNDEDTESRLRSMVGLIANSPYHLER